MKHFRRYSDNDGHLGPYITYGRSDGWKPWSLYISSGTGADGDYTTAENHLFLSAAGLYLIFELPAFIKPYQNPKASWDGGPREYGVQLHDGFLRVFLGPQTHDSTTTKSWSKFLPWTQWRFVRWSMYNPDGSHFWTEPPRPNTKRLKTQDERIAALNEWHAVQHVANESVQKTKFRVIDFDGEEVIVTATIHEREWRFGEGWFKWLSWLRKPKISRTLDLEFSSEVGKDKGSWKGGMTGHGFSIEVGEPLEAAMKRYCTEEKSSKNGKYHLIYDGVVNG